MPSNRFNKAGPNPLVPITRYPCRRQALPSTIAGRGWLYTDAMPKILPCSMDPNAVREIARLPKRAIR